MSPPELARWARLREVDPVVKFSPSEDQALILEAVASLADTLRPRAPSWDSCDRIDPEAIQAVSELGLSALFLTEEEGGPGLGTVAGALSIETLAQASAALALRLSAHAAGVLPALAAAGLPADALENWASTSKWAARLAGVEYVESALKGGARWVVGGADAAELVVSTRDGRVFRLEADQPNIVREPVQGLGMRGAGLAHIRLEGVRVGNPVGRVSAATLDRLAELERLAVSAVGVGIGRAAIDESRSYALARKQFGRPIADFQAIQWMIADAATEVDAAGLLLVSSALALDGLDDRTHPSPSSAALILTAEAALSASQKAIQIHGGYGFVKEFVVERLARDARYIGVALQGRDAARIELGRRLIGQPGAQPNKV